MGRFYHLHLVASSMLQRIVLTVSVLCLLQTSLTVRRFTFHSIRTQAASLQQSDISSQEDACCIGISAANS